MSFDDWATEAVHWHVAWRNELRVAIDARDIRRITELAVLPCQLGVRLRDASQEDFPSRRDLGDLQRWHSECHAEVLHLARVLRSEDESADPDSLSAGSAFGYALALLVGRLTAIGGHKTR